MSHRDWRTYGAIAGLIVLAVIAYVWIEFKLRDYQAIQAQQRQEAAAYDRRRAYEEAYDPCDRLAGIVDRINCVLREINAQRADQRAEYDLEAQQDMATWGRGVYLTSWLMLFVTTAGVLYIALTFRETRRMVDEAAKTTKAAKRTAAVTWDIGRAQTRAYLSCMGGEFTIDSRWLWISPKLKNYGQSPARNIEMRATIFLGMLTESEDGGLKDARHTTNTVKGGAPPIPAGGEEEGTFMVNHEEFGAHFQAMREIGATISVDGIISWKDVFGEPDSIAFFLIQKPGTLEDMGDLFMSKKGKMTAINRDTAERKRDTEEGG